MYHLTVEREFCAAHAITICGEQEPVHGHTWKLKLTVAGPELDADGLLCDFHQLERQLDAVLAPFRNADFNQAPPFDRVNPTAELIAHHIGESVASSLGNGVALESVSITEAPGCVARWFPDE